MFSRNVLTPQEVAKDMKVSLKTVYRWIEAGKLDASQVGVKTYRIMERDLIRFLRKTRVKPKPRQSSRKRRR